MEEIVSSGSGLLNQKGETQSISKVLYVSPYASGNGTTLFNYYNALYASNKVLQNPNEVEREIVSLMSYESFTLLTKISLVFCIIGWLLKIKIYTAGFLERS